MIEIRKSAWPGTPEELDAAVKDFRMKLAIHKNTIGVPAPVAHDLVEYVARSRDEYRIVPDPPTGTSFYARHKQLVDQSAHLVFGALVAAALALALPWYAAFGLMMVAALVRELLQHQGFHLGAGSALDLAFFALGGVLGILPGVLS